MNTESITTTPDTSATRTDGLIVVTHPNWCTNHNTDHREGGDVKTIDDTIGIVRLEMTCPGPTFGGVTVEGTQNLLSGRWHFITRSRWPIGHDPEEVDDLIGDLQAARGWITAQTGENP